MRVSLAPNRRAFRLSALLAAIGIVIAGVAIGASPAEAFSDAQGSFTFSCDQGLVRDQANVAATLDEGETPPVVQELVNGNVTRSDVLGEDGTWNSFGAGDLPPGEYVYTLTLGGSVIAEETFNMPSDCPAGGNSSIGVGVETTCVDGVANVTITAQPPVGEGDTPVGYKASTYNYETFEFEPFGEPQTVSVAGQTIEFTDTRAPGTYDVDITLVVQGPVGGSYSTLFHVAACTTPSPQPSPSESVDPEPSESASPEPSPNDSPNPDPAESESPSPALSESISPSPSATPVPATANGTLAATGQDTLIPAVVGGALVLMFTGASVIFARRARRQS